MTNEWTGGETPEITGLIGLSDTTRDGQGDPYEPLAYTARPYGDVNKDAWNDCIYCGGTWAIPCQYNHVEARENGDARRRDRSREDYVTVVADCKEKCNVFLTPTATPVSHEQSMGRVSRQRYTSYNQNQGIYLRKGV